VPAYDVRGLVSSLTTLVVTTATTGREAADATRLLAPFNECTLGVVRFSGLTPWERHPDGDEPCTSWRARST
jgi:hypothetical protein